MFNHLQSSIIESSKSNAINDPQCYYLLIENEMFRRRMKGKSPKQYVAEQNLSSQTLEELKEKNS